MSDTRETPGETDNKAEQLAAHKKKGLSQTVEAMCKEFVEEEPDPIPPREHGVFWRGTHE